MDERRTHFASSFGRDRGCRQRRIRRRNSTGGGQIGFGCPKDRCRPRKGSSDRHRPLVSAACSFNIGCVTFSGGRGARRRYYKTFVRHFNPREVGSSIGGRPVGTGEARMFPSGWRGKCVRNITRLHKNASEQRHAVPKAMSKSQSALVLLIGPHLSSIILLMQSKVALKNAYI